MITVECGHDATPIGCGSGYATLADGGRICYACADQAERDRMRTAERVTAYLSADGRRVTTWSGGVLASVTESWVSPRARKTYVRAIDVHGNRWHGQGPAEAGNYVNLRRAK